jgi:hypothetical protein
MYLNVGNVYEFEHKNSALVYTSINEAGSENYVEAER